jgi:transcriptional regulator with XRE-family HTH domain
MIMSKQARQAKRDEWYRQFGRRLVVTRLALGITEQEAADAFRITLRTYRRWENGGCHRDNHEGILCFIDKYDVSLDWLLGGKAVCVGDHLNEAHQRQGRHFGRSLRRPIVLRLKSKRCRRPDSRKSSKSSARPELAS